MIKSLLQRILRRLGLYEWFKDETFAYDVYQYLKSGRPVTWRSRELRFFRGLVGEGPGPLLIFDVGANCGKKTDVFLKLGAHVVAVDPDEANLRILARKYREGIRKRPVTIVGKAVSDSARVETLWVTSPGDGLNTLSEKWVQTLKDNPGKFGVSHDFPVRQSVETTTLGSLMEAYGVPRYIKIDVEGHEPRVLRGLPRPVPVVSFEANLPEFCPEAEECVEILGLLSPGGQFNLTSCDSYKGFALAEWRTGPEIIAILRGLGETTVEIYWKPA
jgi:FkbM family methyltransferase